MKRVELTEGSVSFVYLTDSCESKVLTFKESGDVTYSKRTLLSCKNMYNQIHTFTKVGKEFL